jgi:hypothetical protein
MKRAFCFLPVFLMLLMFSCRKKPGENFSENSPERPADGELSVQNLSRKEVKVPEESVKEFFKALVGEGIVLKFEPRKSAESKELIPPGDTVEILSRSIERDERWRDLHFWFKVKTTGGVIGWVYGGDLDFFNTEPGYSVENDLRLLQEIAVEGAYSPKIAGREFIGMVDYLTVDENAGIKEVYLFDKYVLMFVKEGDNFSVFDYNKNLEFKDYPVFGNLVAKVNPILAPIGIWHDFLIAGSEIGGDPKSSGYGEHTLAIYNLKRGSLACKGTYFDDNWPDESNRIKVYEEIDDFFEANTYTEYFFNLTTETLEPTGETKTYEIWEYLDFEDPDS